jgi:hypothetical protein
MNSPLTTPSTTPHDPAAQDPERHREAITARGHELRLLVDSTVRTTAVGDRGKPAAARALHVAALLVA